MPALASARTAASGPTATWRSTEDGSTSGASWAYDAWRTIPSRDQPPISARITSPGSAQTTPGVRASSPGASANGGVSRARASIAARRRARVAVSRPLPTRPA